MKNSKSRKKIKLNISKWPFALIIVGLLLLFILLSLMFWTNSFENSNQIPLTQVVTDLQADKVSEVDILHTRLLIKEGNVTYTAYTEPNFNFYTLAQNNNLNLENTKIYVKDNSVLSFWLDNVFSVLSILTPIVLMGVFFYLIYVIFIKLKSKV